MRQTHAAISEIVPPDTGSQRAGALLGKTCASLGKTVLFSIRK
jgi:hypothetical protein